MNNNQTPDDVWVYEKCMWRMDKANCRLWVVILVLIIALIGTNVGWLMYNSQFETTQETSVEQDIEAGEGDTIISGIGDISFGTNKTEGDSN